MINLTDYKKISLIVLFIIIFTILNLFLYNSIKSKTFKVFGPVQEFIWRQGSLLSQISDGFFHAKELKIENSEIHKRNLLLKEKILEMEEIKKENEDLKKIIDIGLSDEFILFMGKVISVKTEGNSILVDKGKLDGISIGMPVVTSDKILIGKIEKVFKNHSQVSLVAKKGFSFGVKINIEEDKQVIGSATGKGKILEVDFLPKDKNISKGDLVSTAFIGNSLKENFIVGTVSKVSKEDVEAFQKVEVTPYFLKEELNRVFIIKDR